MSTFEDIVHRLTEDLGPMEIAEEPELLITLHLAQGYGDRVQFTASCGQERFRDYMMHVLHTADYVDTTDVKGVVHILHTSIIVRVEIEEESNGDSPASEQEASEGAQVSGTEPGRGSQREAGQDCQE